MRDYGQFNITPDNDNNDRTKAFSVEKKVRRPDSVLWIVAALVIFFLNVVSLARITIMGQFLDDVIFTLPFGWFKYFLYLLFFIVDFAIYFGIKFKPKKRFIAMIFITWIMLCWIISAAMLIAIHYINAKDGRTVSIFSKTIFKDIISWFWDDWKSHSVFNGQTQSWLISPRENYITPFAGGGMIGALLAGIGAYLSIFGGLVLAVICFFIDMIWIFTGDPFYLFKPAHKRKPKRLRILSLRSKVAEARQYATTETMSKKQLKKERKKSSRFGSFIDSINVSDQSFLNQGNIIQSVRDSDITIELPSFSRSMKRENFYEEKPQSFYAGEFKTPEPVLKTSEQYLNLEAERNYNVGSRSYANAAPEQPQSFEQMMNQYPSEPNYQNPMNQPQNFEPQWPTQNQASGQQFIPKRMQENQYGVESNPFIQTENVAFPEEFIGDSIIGNGTSREEAQRKYDLERNLTPFGANGKTQELVRSFRDYDGAKQITIDQVIEQAESENQIKQERRKQFDEFVMPIEDTFSKTQIFQNNSFQPANNGLNQQFNRANSVEKEVYVNKNYILPSNSLLNEVIIDQKSIEAANNAANQKAKAINEVFTQFSVNAKVTKIHVGPSVTKFEVQPGSGTKVNSVINLENDLKFALATNNVLIEAPIQGKAAIGIEIPNDNPTTVALRSALEKIPYNKMNSKLYFGIGKNVLGEVLFGELDKAPHLLVAGSTGSGKSVMINTIICSILMRAKPHEVKFLMIDPKKVELSIYAPIPHLLAPVISDMSLANGALKKVVNEMERRYVLFERMGVKNMEGYNAKETDPKKQLPYYVIVIDELADLMMTGNKKDVEDSIMRLTQMARAAGIHLIVATQRPSTDVITGVIKTNIPTRISFAVASSIDSRTILDSSGAEKLNGRGDLLYQTPGSNSLVRAQGAFISDEEIQNLVNWAARQQEQIFDEEFMRTEVDPQDLNGGLGKDPMFDEIKDYVIREQKASTSLIQRRFSIGYNRAAKIIDQLEEAGIIGPQNGAKPREVFVRNHDANQF